MLRSKYEDLVEDIHEVFDEHSDAWQHSDAWRESEKGDAWQEIMDGVADQMNKLDEIVDYTIDD